jgi:FKBP-type peptidyl-prolyl cis-trans isomerase FkpA
MSTIRYGVLFALLAGFPAACSNSPTSPSNTAPFSQTDLVVGTGTAAATAQTLTVNYTGWFYDGSKPDQKGLIFDTTLGKSPFSFTLGSGEVINGWEQGIPGMQVGGVRRLVIPPSLAYGGTRSGAIPASTTLVFEIELLNAQ